MSPAPLARLKNYRLTPVEPGAARGIEQKFFEMDAIQSSRCLRCQRYRDGGYAWICRPCQSQCTHVNIAGFRRAGDGADHPCVRCFHCGDSAGVIPKGGQVLDICVRDTLALYPGEPCERCGSELGTQLHHWAPVAIFEDADHWPMSYLCRLCHSLWHNSMRAARGVSLLQRVAA